MNITVHASFTFSVTPTPWIPYCHDSPRNNRKQKGYGQRREPRPRNNREERAPRAPKPEVKAEAKTPKAEVKAEAEG